MTLENYIKGLQQVMEFNPRFKDCEVIYSVDDEGNAYHKIEFGPSLAIVEDLDERYLEVDISDESMGEDLDNVNAICIN
jgi:hypothetical protein